jgi:RHS repeat-associated protein
MIGSVRSSTHDDGLNANYYDYDVFGKPFGETNDYGYVGKPYDPTTGMYNYGYRDYSPKTARFTTVDPIRDGHNWYAYCSNDPVNFVDLWGLEDIVIFSAINNKDNFNNIGYSLLVNDSYKKIKKAAKKEGLTVRIVKGKNATNENLQNELKDNETQRLIIIAHGSSDGILWDVNDDPMTNTNIAGANLEIIDLIACYASTGVDNWGKGQDVRTYNPGSSTEDPKDDQEIWWNQTNEAINKKIPESIKNDGMDTSGDPGVKPDPFTKKIVGSKEYDNKNK